ncbi:Uncharacterised protein [Actinobacillus equuli]|nr:Uncharacterised protein [Actinobacillus equuli]
MNIVENQDDINAFIDCVIGISHSVNSDNWNGEDVMGSSLMSLIVIRKI